MVLIPALQIAVAPGALVGPLLAADLVIVPDLSTALVMTVPFLITFLLLRTILFKPLFEYLEERDQASVTARKEASDLSDEIEARVAAVDAKLVDAQNEVAALRAAARQKAHEEEERILLEARAEADRRIEEGVAAVAASREEASRALRETTAQLSTDIASQVLGRPIQRREA